MKNGATVMNQKLSCIHDGNSFSHCNNKKHSKYTENQCDADCFPQLQVCFTISDY